MLVHVMQLTRGHDHLVEAEVGRNLRRAHHRNRNCRPELGVPVQAGTGGRVPGIPGKFDGRRNVAVKLYLKVKKRFFNTLDKLPTV